MKYVNSACFPIKHMNSVITVITSSAATLNRKWLAVICARNWFSLWKLFDLAETGICDFTIFGSILQYKWKYIASLVSQFRFKVSSGYQIIRQIWCWWIDCMSQITTYNYYCRGTNAVHSTNGSVHFYKNIKRYDINKNIHSSSKVLSFKCNVTTIITATYLS